MNNNYDLTITMIKVLIIMKMIIIVRVNNIFLNHA